MSGSPELAGLLPRVCELCGTPDDVRRCNGCQAVYYCGREHQAAHWSDHKKACSAIKKARASLAKEEEALRNHPEDMFTPANVFENGVGGFWKIKTTRPYMQARHLLVDRLLQIYGRPNGHVDAVQTSLDHLLDMLRLCRGDNMGLRDIVPGLLVRLGRDQDAYDFIKWWATTGEDPKYDWGDQNLPFLDIKDADALEPPSSLWPASARFIELAQCVVVTLIKVRILLDLQFVQNAMISFNGNLPSDIRDHLVGSIVGSRPAVFTSSPAEIAHGVETIREQVKNLHQTIHTYNSHFWRSMEDNPEDALINRPMMFSPKSADEARLVVGYTFPAWAETPGAIELIKTLGSSR